VGITVFNAGNGLFHKGSPGKGVAPGDVCLSPPPPPAGPVPVPYVNMLSASDLANGSNSVKIDGNPTALEDHSYISTSTGDEAGTQGGNIITHQTKGKGYFTLWSFDLLIEGKGACRHGDMMGQNCASSPPGCIDMQAVVSFLVALPFDTFTPCREKYDRKKLRRDGLQDPSPEQKAKVRNGPCWECQRDLHKSDWKSITTTGGKVKAKTSAYTSGYKDPKHFTHDHQPPLNVAWYLGGCHMQPSPDAFIKWADSPQAVKPHCKIHSNNQGGTLSSLTKNKSAADALAKIVSVLP